MLRSLKQAQALHRPLFRMATAATASKSDAARSAKRQSEDEVAPAPKKFMPWSQGLKASMDDPNLRVYGDDKVVIIKDKYPKARYHFLVLPKESIPNLKSLKKDHLPLLKHMEEKGVNIANRSGTELDFRYGYHSIPSMSQVHLHVISQDFDSPCLKTKKHWNSFTTQYFIDSEDVINMLEDTGKVDVDTSKYSQMLKKDLSCHICDKGFSTMPALKKHLPVHLPKSLKK